MQRIFALLALVWISSQAHAWIDCDTLDGRYEEETGFFNLEIAESRILSQGKVTYNGQTFYFRHNERLHWDETLRGCVARTTFAVGYYGPSGRLRYCQYPVTAYVREKQSGGYVLGQITPTEIQPGPGCYQLGQTDRHWNMVRY